MLKKSIKGFLIHSFFHGMVWAGIPRVSIYIFCCTERNSEFSSAEWFGTEFWEFASILVPQNGIPSCVLFCRTVRNRIMGVYLYFVPRNGIPSYFLFRGRVRNGIPRFSVPRNNRNSVGNNHLFRLFRLPRNKFFVGNSQPYRMPNTWEEAIFEKMLYRKRMATTNLNCSPWFFWCWWKGVRTEPENITRKTDYLKNSHFAQVTYQIGLDTGKTIKGGVNPASELFLSCWQGWLKNTQFLRKFLGR